MKRNIIDIENLIYDYEMDDGEKFRAIDDVSLKINEGDFISILGHNGSGKSTLAKQLNAMLLPSQGTVWVDGIETTNEGMILDIRQTVGMVFQNPDNQIVSMVVEEDVAFGPENMSVPTNKIWELVNHALKAVGMTKYRKKSPLELSGGQKQRVAIAGIIAMEPKCIVLDEPTAMLDPSGRKEVMDTLKILNKEKNITIILITHHMEEVVDSDYLYVMKDGKITMTGTPKEIFSKVEELSKLGLEVPEVTKLGYELKKAGMDIEDGILYADELVSQIKKLVTN